jgi:hypothetical protein
MECKMTGKKRNKKKNKNKESFNGSDSLSGIVVKFSEEKVLCSVNLEGSSMNTVFPKKIFIDHGLKIGDEFRWKPTLEKRAVRSDEFQPVTGHKPLSDEERNILKGFLEKGTLRKEMLDNLDHPEKQKGMFKINIV